MGRAISRREFEQAKTEIQIGKLASRFSEAEVTDYIGAMLFALKGLAAAKGFARLKMLLERAKLEAKRVE